MTTPVQSLGLSAYVASGSAGNVLTANATIGNTVLLGISTQQYGSGAANDVTSVTTTFGTATKVTSINRSSLSDLEWWIVPVTAAGQSATVTLASGNTWTCSATEWHGAVSSSYFLGGNNGNTSSLALTCTPLHAGDILLVMAVAGYVTFTADPSGNTPAWSVLTGGVWTDTNALGLAYYTVPSTSAVTATWTLSGSQATAITGIGITLPAGIPNPNFLAFM